VAGDPSQVDLPSGERSGLYDAIDILAKLDGISLVEFGEADVVRHPLVTKMVHAYNARDDRIRKARKKRKDKQADSSDAGSSDD